VRFIEEMKGEGLEREDVGADGLGGDESAEDMEVKGERCWK
jgi:hypothetical protein